MRAGFAVCVVYGVLVDYAAGLLLTRCESCGTLAALGLLHSTPPGWHTGLSRRSLAFLWRSCRDEHVCRCYRSSQKVGGDRLRYAGHGRRHLYGLEAPISASSCSGGGVKWGYCLEVEVGGFVLLVAVNGPQ